MTSRIGRPPHPDVLTPAEWRVLEQVRAGRANAEIAVRLGISVNTVKYHVSNMLAKLELPNRHALAAWDGQPQRRFGWLPLPQLALSSIGLGGLARGAAIAGGLAAAATVAAVAIASNGTTPPEPRTDVLLWLSRSGLEEIRLIGLDPLTGAPLTNTEPLSIGDHVGEPLTADGSLFWTTPARWVEPAHQGVSTITVTEGSRLGLAGSGHAFDSDGVVHRWTLPDTDEFNYIRVVGPPANATDDRIYAARVTVDAGPDEVWQLDLDSDQGHLLAARSDVSDLFRTADGRLFILERTNPLPVPPKIEPVSADAATASEFGREFTNSVDEYLATSRDYIVELDPNDGSELARIEMPGPIARTFFSPDEQLLYVLTPEDGAVTIIDLGTMDMEQRSLPPGGPWPGVAALGPFVTTVLSPDGKRLYLTGTDHAPPCDLAIAPNAWCRERAVGVRVVDLPSNSVIYEDPKPNQFALSPDGQRMLTTAISFGFPFPEASDGLTLIDTATFETLGKLDHPDILRAFAFSEDGHRVYAIADGDHSTTADCRGHCETVLVLETDRLDVIGTHAYDEQALWLMTIAE